MIEIDMYIVGFNRKLDSLLSSSNPCIACNCLRFFVLKSSHSVERVEVVEVDTKSGS